MSRSVSSTSGVSATGSAVSTTSQLSSTNISNVGSALPSNILATPSNLIGPLAVASLPGEIVRYQYTVAVFNCIFVFVVSGTLMWMHYQFYLASNDHCYNNRMSEGGSRRDVLCNGQNYLSGQESSVGRMMSTFEVAVFVHVVSLVSGVYGALFLDFKNVTLYIILYTASTACVLVLVILEKMIGGKGPLDLMNPNSFVIGAISSFIVFEITILFLAVFLYVKYVNFLSS